MNKGTIVYRNQEKLFEKQPLFAILEDNTLGPYKMTAHAAPLICKLRCMLVRLSTPVAANLVSWLG